MAQLFTQAAGNVTAVINVGLPMNIRVRPQGWTGFFGMKSIITSATIASEGNFQFMNTMKNSIYVYVFGEKIGEIVISELSFPGLCGGIAQIGLDSGFERVMNYYDTGRISRTGAPGIITVGRRGFPGFMTAFNGSISNPRTGISQFALRFQIFPTDQ